MSFKTKQDYYGLGSVTNLELTATSENKGLSTAEAKGEDGFPVAIEPFGETSAPSCDFVIKGDVTLDDIVMGAITTINTKKYMLSSISISTSAGAAPTMSCSGTMVEAGATAKCTCTLPAISVSGLHHAQLFGAATLTGTGCHLTASTLEVAGQVSTATKDGVVIASDLTDCRLTVQLTIQSSDSSYATPTVTAATGWEITSPLTETNPDADFPSYTVTLTKILTADEDED